MQQLRKSGHSSTGITDDYSDVELDSSKKHSSIQFSADERNDNRNGLLDITGKFLDIESDE